MCEHCNHGQEPLCTCGPVQGGDSFRMAVHLAENMTDVDWHLTYNSLKDIHPYSAGRRQKKKSRRRADNLTRPFETAALIFRAAVSLRLHKPMTTCRDTVADWRLIYRVLLFISQYP